MSEDQYIVVSCDGHVHPALAEDFREYCPRALLEDFDAFVEEHKPENLTIRDNMFNPGIGEALPPHVQKEFVDRGFTAGYRDPVSRIEALDSQGIVAEVMFHGGGSFGPVPFATSGFELRAAGIRMYNQWLADFVSAAPDRFIGVAQVPIWDIDATVREVRWAKAAGLRSVNFPAPRSELPSDYNDDAWDPLWAVCEELELPLNCHSGSGEYPPTTGRAAAALFLSQVHIYGRSGLPYVIFGGAFDRFPGLTLVFTEQRGGWVPATLHNLDAVCKSPFSGLSGYLKKLPSEYWATNCYLGNSFMARFEVEMRDDIGVDRIMWGSDYPHVEGTWPWTRESIRNTFAGLPHPEVRAMLGENAIRCYSLDETKLRAIAEKIGPRPEEVDMKLDAIPPDALAMPTLGFRKVGEYA